MRGNLALSHTDREYEQELRQLRESVLLMGARVEEMIGRAMRSFSRRDGRLAEETIDHDREIDRLELEIDEGCVRVLARRQPVASDLRFVTTTLKIVTDLERIGDLAANICERVLELTDASALPGRASLEQMGAVAQDMVREALDAFIDADAARAERVIQRDSIVDATYAKIFPELLGHMMEDPQNVAPAQKLQSIAKYLERIADHATNLSEMVVYMVRGEDKRHSSHSKSGPG